MLGSSTTITFIETFDVTIRQEQLSDPKIVRGASRSTVARFSELPNVLPPSFRINDLGRRLFAIGR